MVKVLQCWRDKAMGQEYLFVFFLSIVQAPEERAWKCCRCMGVGALGASATEAEELEQGRKEGLAVASSIAAVLLSLRSSA